MSATTMIHRAPNRPGSVPLGRWRKRLLGPSDRSDLARVQRVGSRFIGCGLIVFTIGLIPVIVTRGAVTAPWWPATSVLLVVVPATAVIVASYRPQLANLTVLATLCSLGFVVATVLWFFAWTGDTAEPGSSLSVWLVQFPGVPGLLFALTGHPRLALTCICGSTPLAQTANQLGARGYIRLELYLGSLLTIALTSVFLAVAVVTVRTAMLLDETRSQTIERAAASAASAAQEGERSRFAALIHDKVIAILLAIDVGRPSPALAAHATSALDELDRRDDDAEPATMDADEFAKRVRSAAISVDDGIERSVTIDRSTAGRYPADVVSGMLDAMCEAIRNYDRHAGPGASCLVAADLRANRATVAIVDDGTGFDPAEVRPDRLGVDVAIRRRMAALGGCRADIGSTPGHGTTVVLSWEGRDAV